MLGWTFRCIEHLQFPLSSLFCCFFLLKPRCQTNMCPRWKGSIWQSVWAGIFQSNQGVQYKPDDFAGHKWNQLNVVTNAFCFAGCCHHVHLLCFQLHLQSFQKRSATARAAQVQSQRGAMRQTVMSCPKGQAIIEQIDCGSHWLRGLSCSSLCWGREQVVQNGIWYH